MSKSKYSILRWNGQEGEKAVFIIRENETGKQAQFTPGRVEDIVWVRSNLEPDWKSFQEEPIDNLEDVVF
jgi:hypothetical protein